MAYLRITGPSRLHGEIIPQGAKNEAYQVLAAALLADAPVTIENVPDILDLQRFIQILKGLGCNIDQPTHHTYQIDPANVSPDFLADPEYQQLGGSIRGSLMLLGPLLRRFHEIRIPRPGGDKIGRRRPDVHFEGLQRLGVEVIPHRTHYVVRRQGPLRGAFIYLSEPSVTGTANVMMAAAHAQGRTTIYNAACEPYIQQLGTMLQQMGVTIEGLGTNRIIIEGTQRFNGVRHRCDPDMLEIGSFIGLAAITDSDITIREARIDKLGLIPQAFERLGIQLEIGHDYIRIPPQGHYQIQSSISGGIPTIYDAPWPGITPDLLSIILVVATQAKGNLLIHQKMFESRLFFVDHLIDMGAQIILCDPHRAVVMGLDRQSPLYGIRMRSPDIRAGAALLIAAVAAEGESIIYNIEQIDRGYERIDLKIRQLGGTIERIMETE